METYNKLQEWFLQMGYRGTFPEKMDSLVFNASTMVIWEQLLDIAKPKQELDYIRKNIVISQLRKKNVLMDTDNFQMKEIQLWNKKQKLEQEIEVCEESVCTGENEIDTISKENGALNVSIANKKQEIIELEQKTYMYELKCENTKKELTVLEEKLNKWKQITSDDCKTKQQSDVLDDLKVCAEKLQKLNDKKKNTGSTLNCMLNMEWKFVNESQTPGNMLDNSLGLIDTSTIDMADDETIAEQEIGGNVNEILNKYNRVFLRNVMKNVEEKLRNDLRNCILKSSSNHVCDQREFKEHLAKLNAIHIENQLHVLKYKANVNILEKKLKAVEGNLNNLIIEQNFSVKAKEEIESLISLEKKLILASARYDCISTCLSQLKSLEGSYHEILQAEKRYAQLNQIIATNMKSIENKRAVLYNLKININWTRDDTFKIVRNLTRFTSDLNWTLPLSDNLTLKEVQAFEKVCLHNNRTFIYTQTDNKKFIRDYVLPLEDNFSLYISKLAAISDCLIPTCQEALLLDILKKKDKLRYVSKQTHVTVMIKNDSWTVPVLEEKDALDKVLDKLNCLVHNKSCQAGNIPNMRQAVAIWFEMPFRDFISHSRKFNNLNFKQYQDDFDLYYKQLQ